MRESRRDAKYLQQMKGTPKQPDPSRPGLAIPIKVNIDPPHEESPAPTEGPVDECGRQVRRMRITGVMLQKFGYTEGCDGCRYKRAGMREARPHTEVCRRRIGEAMMGDETDRRKEEEDDERTNWRLAEKMEKILKEEAGDGGDDRKGTGGCDDRAGAGGGEAGARGGLQGGQEAHGAAGGRGPRGSACRSASKTRWPNGVKGEVQGGEKRGPQETKEVQGVNKRPRENAPEGGVGGVAHGPFLDLAAPARERGCGRALQSTPGDR